MDLRLDRQPSTDAVILGRLFLDGVFGYWTLERTDMHIPAGRYRVTITFSPRFGRFLPLVNDVPGRTGIRLHAGNSGDDTAGCILVGRTHANEQVFASRLALASLQQRIADALARQEDVWLRILDPTVSLVTA